MKLVIFDLETTGLDRSKDQIVQFAGLKIDTETNKIVEDLNLYIQPVAPYVIGYAAYLKHKLKPDFLATQPFLKDVAKQIVDFFGDDSVAILTYNGNGFDIPFLKTELNKYGFDIDFTKRKVYDAFLEEKRRNGITLENTYKRYKGKTMEEAGLTAHDAMSDIKATYAVFYAQQHNKPYEPEHMYGEDNVIVDMDFQGTVQPCFNVGKYRQLSIEFVKQIDKGYLEWCANSSGFTQSTKDFIKKYLIVV